jgi:hypothetical protein
LVPKTSIVDISLPLCKKRIERGKGVKGGVFAGRIYETFPGEDRGQVSE